MRKEIENWWKQAENDLVKAETLFKSRLYDGAAFYSQQAVEKALKALMIQENGELQKTHNISKIAKLLQLPQELLRKIAMLEPVYQETRYPDVSLKIPCEEFEEGDTTELLNIAMEVLEWIKKRLK